MTSIADRSPTPHGPAANAVQAHLRRCVLQSEPPWLHTEIARRMAQRLQWIKVQPALVVDWWSVHGGGRGRLSAHYPQARIESVEPTVSLVERARAEARPAWWRRWRQPPPAVWLESQAPTDARAQLVWANMMLHWSGDPAQTFARWRSMLAVDGFVMFSCFGPDTLRQLREVYGRLGWGAVAHDFIDMHDLGDALVAAGFADPVMDMETLRLTWADATRLLMELRSIGGNAATGRCAGLRTPRWRQRLKDEITSALAGADGRLGLDLEIVYGHAFQPTPRLAMSSEVRVSASDLQALARKGRTRAPDA